MAVKQYVVIGLGQFGSSVARTLYSLKNEVLAIDANEEAVQNISSFVTHAVQVDATDEAALKSLGIRNFDAAIIAIGSKIQESIMTTLTVKELGVKYVVAKAQNEMHAKILYKIGADKVVLPERDMGIRLAHNIFSSNILDYIELSPDYSIMEIFTTKEWEGKTLRELNLRKQFGVNVVAIKNGTDIRIPRAADEEIMPEDKLVIIGREEDLTDFEKDRVL